MFRNELPPHSKEAIIDAIAILETVPEAKNMAQEHTVSHLKALVGIKGVMPQYMNDAIAEGVEREKEEKKARVA